MQFVPPGMQELELRQNDVVPGQMEAREPPAEKIYIQQHKNNNPVLLEPGRIQNIQYGNT